LHYELTKVLLNIKSSDDEIKTVSCSFKRSYKRVLPA